MIIFVFRLPLPRKKAAPPSTIASGARASAAVRLYDRAQPCVPVHAAGGGGDHINRVLAAERCPIRFRLRYGHQTSTGRHEMLLGANCCEAVHTWVARRGSNLLTVEHIIRANSFPVMSVKAVSRAKASRAASRAILRQNGVRRGVLHPEASPASRAPSWNTSTRAIPIPRSFISTEFVGEILEKVACREKSAGV